PIADGDTADPVGAGLWEDIGGTLAVVDAEIFIEGAGSIGEFATTTRAGSFWNYESPQDLSNNVFYIWFNCGIVGLLDTKALGGVTVRFTGATATDFIEFYVAGSDDFPTATEGGWVMFVVDIEGSPSNTGGTPPATTAIQRVGVTFITATVMPRMADNCWVDAMWRLPDGLPAILVEGQNGGTADWTWDDIVSTSEASAWGVAKSATGGAIALNGPIQFFADDATVHSFNDTNKVILWEDQEWAPIDLYGIVVSGAASGSVSFTWGAKTGTGDDATGAQGITIVAASAGVRWDFDMDAANIDSGNLYGCTFIHGGDFQLDNSAVECISTAFIDCTSARTDNALVLRCNVVDANTADGVAFITTDDITDIRFTQFEFSDGHAIELTTPIVTDQTSKGNKFIAYGASGTNDAAVYNNAAGVIEIAVTSLGDGPTTRQGAGAATIVVNNIQITLTDVQSGSEVRVYDVDDSSEIAGVEDSGETFIFSDAAANIVDIVIHHVNYEHLRISDFTIPAGDTVFPIAQRFDRTYDNP
ncbi:MAG: hypothetical protein ACXABY_13655, partial [Candidatus Thorarchaeota archaeon]